MDRLDTSDYKSEFESLLRKKTEELQKSLDDGELNEAVSVIKSLQDARDQSLYNEVGRLTRALHSAIHNFHIDHVGSSSAEVPDSLSDMKDATDRLDFVVEMTEKAANKTMDLVEESMPVANSLGENVRDLRASWKKLIDRDISAEEFRKLYWQMDDFFERTDLESTKLYGNLSEILLAQDFQDLTGQVIQKVTGLVREVESSLVDLIYMASQVESITGIVHSVDDKKVEEDPHEGHGPQVNSAEQDDVMSNQDDVDDLLSSLGF